MKRITIFLLVVIMMLGVGVKAQNGVSNVLMQKQGFYEARLELESMLAGDEPLDYERAVFVVENAYRGSKISYEAYEDVLDYHTENIRLLAEANRNEEGMDFSDDLARFETGEEKREKYENLLYNWAIHHYLTDTTIIRVDGEEFVHLPCAYSYDDPMAVLDWEHSQVFNLLDNKTGNCYAMASLFKIFAERFGTDAEICTAPGHVFIVHDDLDGRGYNLELANGGFPGLGTIMTVTYTPVEAVRSGISIRELDERQSVALCLVYLGKSYEYKFGTKTDGFIYDCAETALEHDSLNLNAMLLKAGVLGERLCSTEKNVSQLQNDSEFKEYEALVVDLYEKGYREMPLDMKNLIVNRLKRDSVGLVLVDHTPTSFKSFDAKNERYATLSWGLFDEEHAPKDVEKYGRALLDTKTKKIVGLVEHDVLYNGYPLDVGVFGWAIDPLAAKYPNMSPYVAMGDNPILYVDPDGRDIIVAIKSTDPNSTGDPAGHAVIIVSTYKKVELEIDGVITTMYKVTGYQVMDNNDIHSKFDKNDIQKNKLEGNSVLDYSAAVMINRDEKIRGSELNVTNKENDSYDPYASYVTPDQVAEEQKMYEKYNEIEGRRQNQFNLLTYNCTDFVMNMLYSQGISVSGMIDRATNEQASVTNPNTLYQNLKQMGYKSIRKLGKVVTTKRAQEHINNENKKFTESFSE
jgi:hypothetical protein